MVLYQLSYTRRAGETSRGLGHIVNSYFEPLLGDSIDEPNLSWNAYLRLSALIVADSEGKEGGRDDRQQ